MRLHAKVKDTWQHIMVLRNEVAQMEWYLHKHESDEDCQDIIVDIIINEG
jgi:hypothetical protein